MRPSALPPPAGLSRLSPPPPEACGSGVAILWPAGPRFFPVTKGRAGQVVTSLIFSKVMNRRPNYKSKRLGDWCTHTEGNFAIFFKKYKASMTWFTRFTLNPKRVSERPTVHWPLRPAVRNDGGQSRAQRVEPAGAERCGQRGGGGPGAPGQRGDGLRGRHVCVSAP